MLAALGRRGIDLAPLHQVIELDQRQRDLARQRDDLRNQVKNLSGQVGKLFKEGRQSEAGELQAASRELGAKEKAVDEQAEAVGDQIRQALLVIPNLPHAEAPDGVSEADNPELRRVGYDPDRYGAHQRVPHWEIGTELGILDLERGAKLSGSMFVMYRGGGAGLVRALIQLGLDRNADAFEEIRPPTLVRTETMVSTGHLPKFAEDAYTSNATTSGPSPPPKCPSPRWLVTRCSRRPPCPSGSWPTRPATGARPVRPAGTLEVCCGCTSSTRWRSWLTPPPLRRRRCWRRWWAGPKPPSPGWGWPTG